MDKLIEFLHHWKDYMNDLIAPDHSQLGWSGNHSDTPIYDQLEREWAKQGRLGVSNG